VLINVNIPPMGGVPPYPPIYQGVTPLAYTDTRFGTGIFFQKIYLLNKKAFYLIRLPFLIRLISLPKKFFSYFLAQLPLGPLKIENFQYLIIASLKNFPPEFLHIWN